MRIYLSYEKPTISSVPVLLVPLLGAQRMRNRKAKAKKEIYNNNGRLLLPKLPFIINEA